MTTTSSWAWRTWSDRLDTGRLTKTQVYAFARNVVPLAEQGAPLPGPTTLTPQEAQALVARIKANPVLLTEEQTAQGIEWLDRYGERQLADDRVPTIVACFHHFSYDGSVEWGPRMLSTMPIYTIHLADGRRFQYWFASGWRENRGHAGELWEARRTS